MVTPPFPSFADSIARTIPRERIIQDRLRTLAYGTDASFYRLIPRIVVKVETPEEVRTVILEASRSGVPLTFRAAGTSLSGQAVTDSVLVLLGRNWKRKQIDAGGDLIRLQPGVIGAHANLALAPFGRKIGPDPASINSAMIGGIAANNASGMCCGTAQNSYNTLASMKLILADGSTLDTGEPESRASFAAANPGLLESLSQLGGKVRSHPALAGRIRRKYAMKNTTGYSLNSLVDFTDPFEILQHLMIGSEGTLGFISEITYRTVPDLPHRATSLMLFPDIREACAAVPLLRRCSVDAVELMDRASLRSVEEKPGMPGILRTLDASVASLLVETRASGHAALTRQVSDILAAVRPHRFVSPPAFTYDPAEFTLLWNIRKGLFPSVGAMRRPGTTVIIEDVAFPLERLADATLELQSLFRKHAYGEAIIFGHALEGNLHFVFTQDFNDEAEVRRYRAFLDDVTRMVVRTYDGSLKAEHGTGRNMAPFVGLEWGAEGLDIMREIKATLDPEGILNPGVILNDDPLAHIKNLKPLPLADPVVDKCIECGFCEPQCPSRDLTLTPRQRIIVYREISRLAATGAENGVRNQLVRDFRYSGDETCATDGLCATSCPVGIDTGALVKSLRARSHGGVAHRIAGSLARNMRAVTGGMRWALNIVDAVHGGIGTQAMQAVASGARKLSGHALPLWNPQMPRGAARIPALHAGPDTAPAVVYFPTCITRTMGPSRSDGDIPHLPTLTIRLFEKAGYRVIVPPGVENLCCGMAFASKGFVAEGDAKASELEAALLSATENGRYPVVTDMSPCLYRMKERFDGRLEMYEPARAALELLSGRLAFRRLPITVAIHTTCSGEKMGLAGTLKAVAEQCAERVVVPEGIGCCGWAGDRGFTVPELTASALAPLREAVGEQCSAGYSTSRTCEIGLSMQSGIQYRSILYLVNEATTRAS